MKSGSYLVLMVCIKERGGVKKERKRERSKQSGALFSMVNKFP